MKNKRAGPTGFHSPTGSHSASGGTSRRTGPTGNHSVTGKPGKSSSPTGNPEFFLKLAAFKVGQTVEYTGARQVWADSEMKKPILIKGIKVKILEVHGPKIGFGFIKNDEDGEPLIDHDKDGYNVYENSVGQRTIIWPANKNEWKLIK